MVEKSVWQECYKDSWKGIIAEAAYVHPAKFSKELIFRIIQHAMEEGFIQAGDTIFDPFGGVALGGLPSGLKGVRWVGLELEQRFVDLGHVNITLWNKKYGHLPQWVAPICLQGDSRHLIQVLREQCTCVVASPPYAESLNTDNNGIDRSKSKVPGGTRESRGAFQATAYSASPDNLGNLPPGSLDAAIASPPYAASLHNNESPDADAVRVRGKAILHSGPATSGNPKYNLGNQGYGTAPGQLSALPPGSLDAALVPSPDCVIASPPHLQGLGKEHTYADPVKREHDSHRRIMTEKKIADPYYGSDPAQLGNMAPGCLADVALSSPPYAQSIHDGNGIDASKLTGNPAAGHSQAHAEGYGHSEGQLGAMAAVVGKKEVISDSISQPLANEPQDTFWSAARTILGQVFAVLRPGGYTIWIVKSYCREGKIVDFPGQWRALAEHVGFVTLHEHHAMLVETHSEMGLFGEPVVMARTARKSFFRRLYENAHPENAIDYEVVFCMQKAPSPVPLPPDDAWQQLPLIDGCVCSPPWLDQEPSHAQADTPSAQRLRAEPASVRGQRFFATTYSTTPGQLGKMPAGSIDLALTSPPYAGAGEVLGTHNGIDYSKSRTDGKRRTPAREASGLNYGTSPGQLGAMPPGTFFTAKES